MKRLHFLMLMLFGSNSGIPLATRMQPRCYMWIVECAIENYACARAIAVVVPYEAGALVTRKACFPCLGIVFDLLCGRKLFVWRIEACDF